MIPGCPRTYTILSCPFLLRAPRFRLNDNYLGLRVASLLLSLARSTTFVAADVVERVHPPATQDLSPNCPYPRRDASGALRRRRFRARERHPNARNRPSATFPTISAAFESSGSRSRRLTRPAVFASALFSHPPCFSRSPFPRVLERVARVSAMSPWCIGDDAQISATVDYGSRAAFISYAWSLAGPEGRRAMDVELVNIATARSISRGAARSTRRVLPTRRKNLRATVDSNSAVDDATVKVSRLCRRRSPPPPRARIPSPRGTDATTPSYPRRRGSGPAPFAASAAASRDRLRPRRRQARAIRASRCASATDRRRLNRRRDAPPPTPPSRATPPSPPPPPSPPRRGRARRCRGRARAPIPRATRAHAWKK